MIRLILTLTAFINAQMIATPLMAADDAIHQGFKNSIEQMQNEVAFEGFKKDAEAQKQVQQGKIEALEKGIQDDVVVLQARLNELDYLSDYLSVDREAKIAVEKTIQSSQRENKAYDLAEVSAVVALLSGATYWQSSKALNDQGLTRGEKAAQTRAINQSNIFKKTWEGLRGNATVKNASVVTFVAALLVTSGALVYGYEVNAAQRATAVNQSQVYLSKFVSGNQNDYLDRSQITQALSQKPKDKAFADMMTGELNNILKDADTKRADIFQRKTDIEKAKAEMSNLDQQIASKKAQLQESKKLL